MAGRMRSMFEHKWTPIEGFENWHISDYGEVKNFFSGHIPPLYVRKGQIRVELTDSEGRYVEVKLATILKKAFPKGVQ